MSQMRRVLPMVLVGGLLAACNAGPPPKIYLLDAPSSPPVGVTSQSDLPIIELKKVIVPDYLDSTDILRRTGPQEVTASPTGRWGERLSLGLTDALAASLARRVPGALIATDLDVEPALRLSVQIDRFDIDANGRCLIAAQWRVAGRTDKAPAKTATGSFAVTAGASDDAAVAAAMTQVILQLADHIAATLGTP